MPSYVKTFISCQMQPASKNLLSALLLNLHHLFETPSPYTILNIQRSATRFCFNNYFQQVALLTCEFIFTQGKKISKQKHNNVQNTIK